MASARLSVAWLLIAILWLGFVYSVVQWARRREPLLPWPRRYRFVPWTGPEVAMVLFVYIGIQALASSLVSLFGFSRHDAKMETWTLGEMQALTTSSIIAVPGVVLACLALMREFSRTKPRHLGLSRWRWQSSLLLGYLLFLIVTPLVLGVNYVADFWVRSWGQPSTPHPLTKLGGPDGGLLSWMLLIIQAVVAAPLVEEFIFRGVMLPWLSERRWGGWVAMAGAIAIGFAVIPLELLMSVKTTGRAAFIAGIAPLAFALGVSLLGIALTAGPHDRELPARRAIVGTSILFAMTHYSVWPSPIPLVVLGLALGWAAHRTRSLIAPIAMHALFNAVPVLTLLIAAPNHQNGKADTSAANRPAPVSTSIAVPGVWWP